MSIHPALLVLADGRFPAGGHANSAGVEAAVRCGDVVDAASLERFLRGRLRARGDLGLVKGLAELDATTYSSVDDIRQ